MYRSRNRTTALLNLFIMIEMLMFAGIKKIYPSYMQTIFACCIFTFVCILGVVIGIKNILNAKDNNQDEPKEKTLYLISGILIIVFALIAIPYYLSNITPFIKILFLVLNGANIILSIFLIGNSLHLKDSNYEFLDRKGNMSFKIFLILILLTSMIPILNIECIKFCFRKLSIELNDQTYYLIIEKTADEKASIYNAEGEFVKDIDTLNMTQTLYTQISRENKLIYSYIYDEKNIGIVNLASTNLDVVKNIKVRKNTDIYNFNLLNEIFQDIFNRGNEENVPKEKVEENKFLYKYVELLNPDFGDYEYEDEEMSNYDEYEYRYFRCDKNNNIVIQIAYLPQRCNYDQSLAKPKVLGTEDFYGWKKIYYIIDLERNTRDRVDVEHFIFGGYTKSGNKTLTTIYGYDEDKIPFKGVNESGYYSISEKEKHYIDSNTILLDLSSDTKIIANTGKTLELQVMCGDEKQEEDTYDKFYVLDDFYILKNDKGYLIYSKQGKNLGQKNYDDIYTLNGKILAAKNIDETGSQYYDIYDKNGIMNENIIRNIDLKPYSDIDEYTYKGVYAQYLD